MYILLGLVRSRLTENSIERKRHSQKLPLVFLVRVISCKWDRNFRGNKKKKIKKKKEGERGKRLVWWSTWSIISRVTEYFPRVERSIESIFESLSHPEISFHRSHSLAYAMTRLHRRRLYWECLRSTRSGGSFDFLAENKNIHVEESSYHPKTRYFPMQRRIPEPSWPNNRQR